MIVVDVGGRSSLLRFLAPETRAAGASRLVTVRAVGAGTANHAAKHRAAQAHHDHDQRSSIRSSRLLPGPRTVWPSA